MIETLGGVPSACALPTSMFDTLFIREKEKLEDNKFNHTRKELQLRCHKYQAVFHCCSSIHGLVRGTGYPSGLASTRGVHDSIASGIATLAPCKLEPRLNVTRRQYLQVKVDSPKMKQGAHLRRTNLITQPEQFRAYDAIPGASPVHPKSDAYSSL